MASVPSRDLQLVVVSGYPPNAVFGGGVILRSLLADYPLGRLTVVTNGRVLDSIAREGTRGGLLSVPHVGVVPWRSEWRGMRRLLRSANAFKVLTAAIRVARATGRRGVILAVPWGGEFGSELFMAAYLAHRFTRTPLVVYELDEWRASLGEAAGRVARLIERLFHGAIARAAATVWVMSDSMADTLRQRLRVDARVLDHAVDLDLYPARVATRSPRAEFRLVYAGSVYRAQAGAIANVARALERLGGSWRLVLYTSRSASSLASLGITGACVTVEPPVPADSIPDVLQAADALLLPLAFDRDQRQVVSTSFPTKTVDYLASGVPVLVHAPPYSTICERATNEGWGIVVSEESEEHITEAVEQLRLDEGLRQRLVERARAVARDRHDLRKRQKAFLESIENAGAGVSGAVR